MVADIPVKRLVTPVLLSLSLCALSAWSDDNGSGSRTGFFRATTTPLELLGERGAQTLSEVFAPDEKLRWQLDVPENYDPAKAPGAIVFVNRGNWGGGKKAWSKVLSDRNLIWIGAIDAGDKSPMNERMLKAILAPTLLDRDYAIDPERIYVAGFSGGAHVANILATSKPALFKGGLFLSGAVFWEDRMPAQIDLVRQNRYVFIAGQNDVARTKVSRTAQAYREAGVTNTELVIVPNTRQELPGPSYFEAAIDYLDSRSSTDRDST